MPAGAPRNSSPKDCEEYAGDQRSTTPWAGGGDARVQARAGPSLSDELVLKRKPAKVRDLLGVHIKPRHLLRRCPARVFYSAILPASTVRPHRQNYDHLPPTRAGLRSHGRRDSGVPVYPDQHKSPHKFDFWRKVPALP